MGTDEINVLIKDAKRKLSLHECALRDRARPMCAHNFVERPVRGPRDNGEFECVCTKCGLIYG